MQVKLRAGGERLQPDARRPRRTLKNLFQEAGVPAWERERLPLLYRGDALVWAPGLGVDARVEVLFAKAGSYRVRVRDSRYSDQTQNFYRLKIGSYLFADGIEIESARQCL